MTMCATGVPDESDLALVQVSLRELRDYSNLAAAELLGVSEATVRRWRAGNIAVPLRTATRLALRSFLDGKRIRLEKGGTTAAPTGQAFARGEDLAPFSVPRIRDYIGEIAPPGKETTRKMDALDGIRTTITARSAVPQWWYSLRDQVKAGDL